MSLDAHHTDSATGPAPDLNNLLVPPAIAIVAGAMGVAGYLHLGLTIELACAVGLALFCLMLLCHILLRAASAVEKAAEVEAERRTVQVASPITPARRATPTPAAAAEVAAPVDSAKQPLAATIEDDRLAGPSDPPALERRAQPSALAERILNEIRQADTIEKPDPTIQLASEIATARQAMQHDQAQQAAATTGSQSPPDWSYRPVDPGLPTADTASAAGNNVKRDANGARPPPLGAFRPTIAEHFAHPGEQSPPRTEADRIDMILKRLASQIRTGAAVAKLQADEQAAAQLQAGQVQPATNGETSTPPAASESVAGNADPGTPAVHPDTALASAVDALRSTVEAMRAGTRPADSTTARPGPYVTPAEVRLAAVAEALVAERADVFLEPILGLANEQARHFEVSVRLRSASGEPLDSRSICVDVGGDNAGGAGLLPLLDALGVRHAAGFALKLERRGRDGTVFSQIAGQSLESDRFVTEIAERHAQGIADRLVLTFAQNEMRGLGPAQLAALGDLGRLGFRFALQDVSELDMDFEALRALGFEFMKLDAEVFLRGLQCGGVEVPASDLCRHFGDLGLAVIVSGIHHQDLHQRVRGCGVAYGQGQLFGGPRPVPVAGSSASMAA